MEHSIWGSNSAVYDGSYFFEATHLVSLLGSSFETSCKKEHETSGLGLSYLLQWILKDVLGGPLKMDRFMWVKQIV